MKDNNLEIKIGVDSKTAIKQIEKTAKAAERLKYELDKLNKIEIKINFIETNSKWWEFWK